MHPMKSESKGEPKHEKWDNVESILPLDRISNIPQNVAQTILMCLPTRDAVRTSVLSRRWRHVWARLPQFVFDQPFWENVAQEHSTGYTLMKIMYQILTHRDGNITKFTLSNPELESCPEIDNLIVLLARCNLEDFTLEMWRDGYFLPYSFFSCQKLRHLRLRSCWILRSSAFNGFGRLVTLELVEVIVDSQTLSSLISGSPLLVHLVLLISGRTQIYIDAPSLRTFTFRGTAECIIFKRVPVLASVSIKPSDYVDCRIEQFFHPLVSLESLELNNYVFENFVYTVHQDDLPTRLIYLKDLKLSNLRFTEMEEFLFTFWLLRSSPNLKFIKIKFVEDSGDFNTDMEEVDFSDIWLSELKEVKLDRFIGTKQELELTRLLLAKSSALKKFLIQLKDDDGCFMTFLCDAFEILKQVTKFPRLSNEAEVIVK